MAERICGGSACGEGGKLATKHLCHQRVNSHPLSWLHKAQMSHIATVGSACLSPRAVEGNQPSKCVLLPKVVSHLDGNVLPHWEKPT